MKKIITIAIFFCAILLSHLVHAKTLHMITSLDPLEASEYIKAFEKGTGVDVVWIRLSAGEVLARLKTEGGKTSQSVWFGGPIPEYIASKEAHLLEPYLPSNIKNVPKKWYDPEGYWIGIYYGYIGFVYNTNFFKEKNLTPPTSWYDLLKPEFKGRVTVSYPYTAGTGFTIFSGLATLLGVDDAISYWKKLDQSVHHYTKSGSAPILEVGLGEAAIGVVFSQDIIRKGILRGFPVAFSFPKEGIPFEVGGVAIIKGAPELKEAKKFVDWIISKSAQDSMHKWARIPIHPKAKIREDMKRPGDMKLVDMDFIELGAKRGELIEIWRNELRQ